MSDIKKLLQKIDTIGTPIMEDAALPKKFPGYLKGMDSAKDVERKMVGMEESSQDFQFTDAQLKWLGGADRNDPYILARMPGPKPPVSYFKDPENQKIAQQLNFGRQNLNRVRNFFGKEPLAPEKFPTSTVNPASKIAGPGLKVPDARFPTSTQDGIKVPVDLGKSMPVGALKPELRAQWSKEYTDELEKQNAEMNAQPMRSNSSKTPVAPVAPTQNVVRSTTPTQETPPYTPATTAPIRETDRSKTSSDKFLGQNKNRSNNTMSNKKSIKEVNLNYSRDNKMPAWLKKLSDENPPAPDTPTAGEKSSANMSSTLSGTNTQKSPTSSITLPPPNKSGTAPSTDKKPEDIEIVIPKKAGRGPRTPEQQASMTAAAGKKVTSPAVWRSARSSVAPSSSSETPYGGRGSAAGPGPNDFASSASNRTSNRQENPAVWRSARTGDPALPPPKSGETRLRGPQIPYGYPQPPMMIGPGAQRKMPMEGSKFGEPGHVWKPPANGSSTTPVQIHQGDTPPAYGPNAIYNLGRPKKSTFQRIMSGEKISDIFTSPEEKTAKQARIASYNQPQPVAQSNRSVSAPAAAVPTPPSSVKNVSNKDILKYVNDIAAKSGITNPNLIRPGQVINLPSGGTYTVKAGDNLWNISKRMLSKSVEESKHSAASRLSRQFENYLDNRFDIVENNYIPKKKKFKVEAAQPIPNAQDPTKQTTSPQQQTTSGTKDVRAEKNAQQVDIATAKNTMSGLKNVLGPNLDINQAASAVVKINDQKPLTGPEQQAMGALTPLIAKAAETPQTASNFKNSLSNAAYLAKLGK